ncbi:MAG: hypothetical protein J5735_05600, partial [Prevotella sp.]|nr:hypothetical protein [Prevotella sp.]
MFEKIKTVYRNITEEIKNNEIVILFDKDKSKFESWVNSHGLVKFIFVGGIIIYVLETFNSQIMFRYDDNFIPIL